MSVRSRTIYITFAITLVAFIYYMSEQMFQYHRTTELLHQEQVKIIENYYNNFPNRIRQMLLSSSNMIMSDQSVRAAFLDQNRVDLHKLSNKYYNYMDMVFSKSGMVLNYIRPDGSVIYRAQAPEVYDDSIADRPMIAEAMKTGRRTQGVELGRYGLFLRNVEPVMNDRKIAGYIETGVHITFFARRIENLANIKTYVLLKSEYAQYYDRQLPEYDGCVMYFNNTELPLKQFMEMHHGKQKNLDYVRFGGKNFEIIKEFKVTNFKGEQIGDYVFFAERSILHSWYRRQIFVDLIIGLFGVGLIVLIIRNGFVKNITQLEEEHQMVLGELMLTNANLETRIQEEVDQNRQKDQIINQQQKVEDMGQMLSAVSHHWRQPINAIGLYIQDMMEAHQSGELDEAYIKEFERNNMILLKNLSESIDLFKSFYRPSDGAADFMLADIICSAAHLLEPVIRSSRIELLFSADCEDMQFRDKKMHQLSECGCKKLRVHGPVNEFRQVIINVLFNAIDAVKSKYQSEPGGVIRVGISDRLDNIVLDVADNGVGIRKEDLEKIFNPFFTTKDEGEGLGLGLYMSKTIIERHMGGRLTVTSYDGETSFRITLKKA